MGLAKDYAQVEVNSSVASRKGTYFRSEVSVSNSSSSVYQTIDVEVSYGGQQSTESGSTFVPKTPEAFTYDANGNHHLGWALELHVGCRESSHQNGD